MAPTRGMKALALSAIPRAMPGSPGKSRPTGASGLTVELHAGHESVQPVLGLGERIDPLVAKSVVERHARAQSPLVLCIQAEPRDVNPAAEVAEPLIEGHRRAEQQVGHGIVGRKRRREDVERVGRDRLNHVDPGAPELAADLDEMAATGPGQCVLDFEGALGRVARTGDRAADRRIAADVEKRRPLADVVRGVVAEPERARRRLVEALVEEELCSR